MIRFDTYLSGVIQPSVFFDFGEGKIFCNKFAEALRPFPLTSGETENDTDKKQYIYTLDGENTNKICPRCVSGIGGNGGNNIKVDVSKVKILDDDKGVLFNQGDTEPTYEIGYRPSIIAMPQYAAIKHNGVVYGEADAEKPIDGELFTIVVEPNIELMYELDDPSRTDYDYITRIVRKSSVLLFADRRRLKSEAYNDYEFYPEDDYDDEALVCKFKVGDQYCDIISLCVGSMVRLRCVTNGDEVYWEVLNRKDLTQHPAYISFDLFSYYDEDKGRVVVDNNGMNINYEGVVYASRFIGVALSHITDSGSKHVSYKYWISNDTSKDWRDRVIDANTYEDY